MIEINQLEKIVANLQEALLFLKSEAAKMQLAVKRASDLEQQAEESIALSNQKVAEFTRKEGHLQRQSEDLTIRENKIKRHEDFETQLASLERDRAALANEKTLFTTEVRRRREELNSKAEDILLARREIDQQKKQLDTDRRNLRQEIIQAINKEA